MTQKNYSLVVFDWDGTLMDSTPAIVRAIQASCEDLGYPVPPDEAAAWVIGLSLDEALSAVVPSLGPADLERFVARYRFHYLTRDPELRLFEGVLPMLEALKHQGALLAVATGKSRRGLERALDNTGLRPYFDITRCADESRSKPHPAMLFDILDHLMLEAGAGVMIGDTSHDLHMAKQAGMDAVGVTYGAHKKEILMDCAPLGLFSSTIHLDQWLRPQVVAAYS